MLQGARVIFVHVVRETFKHGETSRNKKVDHLSDKGSICLTSLIRRHPRPEVWVSSDMAVSLIQ